MADNNYPISALRTANTSEFNSEEWMPARTVIPTRPVTLTRKEWRQICGLVAEVLSFEHGMEGRPIEPALIQGEALLPMLELARGLRFTCRLEPGE